MSIKERLGILATVTAAAMMGGAVGGYLMNAATLNAAGTPKLVTARKFVLVDEAGRTRGQLEVSAKGVAQLALFDDHNHIRAGLGVAHDGAPGLA
ncbi:MAG TPA: hypothetical protein VNF49_01800, partial [Candidatus Binataceae bacterium]|nr:hypothetical protein [Candidatus Binataceae bacterium]